MLKKPARGLRLRRLLTLVTLAAVTLIAGAGAAAAHVTVNPSSAPAGDFTKLTFRVPNESDTAGTVAVTVTLPTDHPLAFVSVKQVPGWTVTPTKQTLAAPVTEGDLTIKEAVTSVTWTAQAGNRIGPGEFAEFEISAGPVPDVASLEFPTTQTYDDGTVVEWNEPTPASGEEPEHPAPTLTVAAAGDAEDSHSDETAAASTEVEASAATVSAASATGEPSGGSDSTAVILAVIGIAVAAAALLTAAVALRRRPTTGEKT